MTIRRSCLNRLLAMPFVIALATLPARADILADWATVKAPPPPDLTPVMLDGKITALLILDVMKDSCARRPRCSAIVPNLRQLHDAARASGAMVFYTLVGGGKPDASHVVEGLTPREGEWVFQRGPDKFLGSPLEERLKQRGIRTVIVTGTSAQGVGIGTGSGAAQRGYKVIVPIDGLASDGAYQEQYAIWHLYRGGPAIVTDQVTVTRVSLIRFQ
jgi:nicotinamidase-related amidase